jgi:hypothetical protein
MLALAALSAFAAPPPPPAPARCVSQKHLVTASLNNSGQTVEGPICAQAPVNAFRYSANLQEFYGTPTAGPTLGSALPSGFGGSGAVPEVLPPSQSLNQDFNAYYGQVQALSNKVILQASINRANAAMLVIDLAKLQAAVTQSDEIFNTSQTAGVIAFITDDKGSVQSILKKITTYTQGVKSLDDQYTALQSLQASLNALPLAHPQDTGVLAGDACLAANVDLLGWSNWDKCNDAVYKLAQSAIATAITNASVWTADSTGIAQYAKNLSLLQYWVDLTGSLAANPNAFTLQLDIRCGILFNQNQPITVKLNTVDRTGMFPGQTAQQPVSTTLINVNCSSAFAVTAGAAFGVIDNPVYAEVTSAPASGGTTPVTKFGLTSDSKINPYPIALAHARLKDWADNKYALHYSFGAGVNPNSSGSSSASPEFLTGVSISFLRTIYVTGGLDVGKQTSLAGGFHVGDTVPTGVATVPTSTSYTAGFGFAITFTKP